MPLNVPGLLVPFQLIFNPRIVLPGITVRDIRFIDFLALRKAGYSGAVFDKDNCLTLPYRDALVPELQEAWNECLQTFGKGNILVVSNSAGTKDDAGEIQAESVRHHLGAPVLRHNAFKPAYSCIASIRRYFASLPTPVRDDQLIVIGDRVFTDVVLANRMRQQREQLASHSEDSKQTPNGPLAIWTTGVWERESMLMRWAEKKLVDLVTQRAGMSFSESEFVKRAAISQPPEPQSSSYGIFDIFNRLKRIHEFMLGP